MGIHILGTFVLSNVEYKRTILLQLSQSERKIPKEFGTAIK